MAAFSLRRVGLVLTGAFLAGVAATILQAVGIRPVYAVVIGLSGAMPVLLEGMRPVEPGTATDPVSRFQRSLAEIIGAFAFGMFGAFALVLADVSQGFLVGGSTIAAYVGGFMARAAITGRAADPDDD